MADDTYLTVARLSEGLYKEKMSKFISFAIPVSTLDEVKETIARYQKEYYDARHVCWGMPVPSFGRMTMESLRVRPVNLFWGKSTLSDLPMSLS